LPFYIFLKRFYPRVLQCANFKKGAPSEINRLYKRRKIDAGFISSIKSRRQKGTKLGVIARSAVTSVLVLEGDFAEDSESDTSNALARLLGLKGRVAIGDKALKLYLDGAKAVDLALEWQARYKMPFVFSRLCYTSQDRQIRKMERLFLRRFTRRAPSYILLKWASERRIEPQAIKEYLNKLEYRLDLRAARALNKFLFLTRRQ
jgi:chorismate dehydratase